MAETYKSPHIALIDADQNVLDSISVFFKSKGYEMNTFTCAKEALDESSVIGTAWDALLTEFNFSDLSEDEFIFHIKKKLPQLPIVLINRIDNPENEQRIQFSLDTATCGSNMIHLPMLQNSVEKAIRLSLNKSEILKRGSKIKSIYEASVPVIGQSAKYLKVIELANKVASSSSNIVITGESGVGKEVLAKYIHNKSLFANGPFVAINCSAIPENLLESELFGHVKGSFTGALDKRMGLFEEAQNGTLFLDEIGDLCLDLQAKLLRVVQEKKIKRIGENQYRNINCRIICATNKNLIKEVDENRFREDLYFRLNVITIFIPPLRERKDDIFPLAESFLRKFAFQNGMESMFFSKEAKNYLIENPWRGNVRELENTIERAVVISGKNIIGLEELVTIVPNYLSNSKKNEYMQNENSFLIHCKDDKFPTLNEVINKYIEFAILKNSGARDKTARELGIDRKTLYKRLSSERLVSV